MKSMEKKRINKVGFMFNFTIGFSYTEQIKTSNIKIKYNEKCTEKIWH